MKKYSGSLLLVLGIGILVGVIYMNNAVSRQVRIFSSYTLLTSSWENYKTRFINKDGRVIDYSQEAITTSEGQSYAMLQAVWIDDKDTFDKVWLWTKTNLDRPNDNLFGWRWGKMGGENYGLLPDGGNNSASDADGDIALALVLAGKRWNNEKYIDEARGIVSDMWKIEVDTVKGKPYLTAGSWAKSTNEIVVNPSYFAPYQWRVFAKIDTKNNWNSLIDPAYELLSLASHDKLDKEKAVGLPPDWMTVSKVDGKVSVTNLPKLTTGFGYDAMRVPWRIALDYIWNKEPKAKEYLTSFSYLKDLYNKNQSIPGSFSHDGQITNSRENPAMYANLLGYFMVVEPDLAKKIYEQKITNLYSNDTNSFRNDLAYYEENWLWFGAALYSNYLVMY